MALSGNGLFGVAPPAPQARARQRTHVLDRAARASPLSAPTVPTPPATPARTGRRGRAAWGSETPANPLLSRPRRAQRQKGRSDDTFSAN